ncbi:MFS transporter [Glycomyces arizonensis]|uniref:MFS transporter n=1 Tax=Glycomyces arizonensis TaxID=256035 RepID=UPI000425BA27|nr:MFS transporter [Glycomyces arizonensis]
MASTSADATRTRRRFIAASLVDSVGNGIYVPLTMLFVHALTGLSLFSIGAGLTAAGIGALAFTPVAGALIDRFSGRRVFIGALALRAVGFALYPIADAYLAFLAVALIIAVGAQTSQPSQHALIGDLAEGAERDRLLAWNRSLRNGGMGFGSLAAGALLMVDGTGGFIAAALAMGAVFATAAILVVRVPATRKRTPAPEGPGAPAGFRQVLADRPYLRLTGANFLIAFCYIAQSIALPVYLTRDVGVPEALAGTVFAVNTAMVAALGVPTARLASRGRRTRGAALGAVAFAVAFAAFAALPHLVTGALAIAAVLAVAVLYTAAELIHSAPAQSLSVQAAPEHLRGRYLAVYQLSWSLARSLAPVLIGFLLDAGSWQLWAALGLAAVSGAAVLLRTERVLPPHAVQAPEVATAA